MNRNIPYRRDDAHVRLRDREQVVEVVRPVRAVLQNEDLGVFLLAEESEMREGTDNDLPPECKLAEQLFARGDLAAHERKLFLAPVAQDRKRQAQIIVQVAVRAAYVPFSREDRGDSKLGRCFPHASGYRDHARTMARESPLGELLQVPAEDGYERASHGNSQGVMAWSRAGQEGY